MSILSQAISLVTFSSIQKGVGVIIRQNNSQSNSKTATNLVLFLPPMQWLCPTQCQEHFTQTSAGYLRHRLIRSFFYICECKATYIIWLSVSLIRLSKLGRSWRILALKLTIFLH